MNFRIGDQVRINVGPWYGKLGRVVSKNGRFVNVQLFVGSSTIQFDPSDLLDSYANNGD